MDQLSLEALHISDEDEFGLDELENALNYKFKNRSLLEEAMTHSSVASTNNINSYERLEFVGDSVLGQLISTHIYQTYPHLQPGTLTLLRSRNVDTEKFARVGVKHKFYLHLRIKSADLQALIENFVKEIEKPEAKSFRLGDFKPPKVLADIVESIAGAVFVDNGYSTKKLWKLFKPLLEPLITPETLEMHPVSQLHELCQKHGKKLEYRDSWTGNLITVHIFVDGELFGSSESQQKDLAERVAAKIALDRLTKKVAVHKGGIKNGSQLMAVGNLNNFCYKRSWPKPEYSLLKEEGRPDMKKYTYSVSVQTLDKGWTDKYVGEPMARINEAKDSAAKPLLDFLKKMYKDCNQS
eukprot:Gb_39947 [translate_table: standard]